MTPEPPREPNPPQPDLVERGHTAQQELLKKTPPKAAIVRAIDEFDADEN